MPLCKFEEHGCLQSNLPYIIINSLPNNESLDWSKLKAFVDNKINNIKTEIIFGMGRKHCRKRRKFCLPAFSLPTLFSKGLFFRIIKSGDCVVKG